MSERWARALLAAIGGALVTLALNVDLAKLSGGRFWSDGATYHAMAWSLAEDFDLRYEARDVFRSRREFAEGPQGIFLKRSSGGFAFDGSAGFPWLRRVPDSEPRIYYAKAFAYPFAAAPLVRLFGTRGLILANALALLVALAAAYAELRRGASAGVALAAASVLVLGTVAPLYLLWPTPELFNVGLIAAGLWAWRRDRPALSAVLLGAATFSKPSNLFLALPLGLSPLFARDARGMGWGLLEALRRGAILACAAGALYGLNFAVTGEANYQGGRERKTFYGRFPLETHGVTFGNSGIWMSTNQIGPSVQGEDDAPKSQGSEPARARSELRAAFAWNLLYFWVGRYAGALAYFFPMMLAASFFVARGPRSVVGWLALAALLASCVLYLWLIPDNWYGGSGTIGNRYFLNLLPLAAFLVPVGRARWVAVLGALIALPALLALFAAPMDAALRPGQHAMRAPFRWLPAELTMLNDLSIFGEPWRKKQPVGDVGGGDPRNPRPAQAGAHFLYFTDDGTYGREERDGRAGFRVKAGQTAEVLVRALYPVARVRARLSAGGAGDRLTVRLGWRSQEAVVSAGETREVVLEPSSRGVVYKETFVHVMRFRSLRSGAPGADDTFVQLVLDDAPGD